MTARSVAENGVSVGVVMLAGAIPTNSLLINVSIGLIILSWLIGVSILDCFRKFTFNPILIAFLLFYSLHIISLLYTDNLTAGVFNLEKKLSILIFPLVLGSGVLNRSIVRIALWTFVGSCFMVSAICLFVALFRWVDLGDSSVLFYDSLLYLFGFQAVYFGMYLVFACLLLLIFLPVYRTDRRLTALLWAGIAYFLLFTILLSARMATLVMIVIVLVQGYRYARVVMMGRQFVLLIIFLAAVSVLIVWNSEFLSQRVLSIVGTKLYFDPKENNANGLTLRLVKWECSIVGALESPVMGVGPGDCQDVLQKCYKEKQFWGAVFEFNSHSQYLQTLLGLGGTGLLVFLFCLFGPLWLGGRKNSLLYSYFAFLMGMSFLTESMLERQQGVIFYSFFSSLLIFTELQPKAHE